MFYSTDARHEKLWRVGIAQNAVFFQSFVASRARKLSSEKRGGAEQRLPKMSTKFAPRLRVRTISLKTDGVGALLEVELTKICTTPAHESDLEVKIVKNWHARSTFGSWAYQNVHHACARERYWRSRDVFGGSKCFSRGRRRSSWGLQKRCQAWWIWRGSETMGFAWQVQWFRSLWCRFLKPPTQNPRKGCKFHVTEVLLCKDHFAWQLQDFLCFGSTFSWQARYFWSIHLKIAKTYWNSEAKCLVDMSFLKDVSQKCFVFDLQSLIFEGSLAEMLRFGASKFHFWRKSRRKASFLSCLASIWKEVSQKRVVFECQGFVFGRKSRRKASLSQSFLRLNPKPPNHSNHKAIDNHIRLSLKSIANQHHLSLKINAQPDHLNLKSIDNQITWISNQLPTKSLESQTNWQPTSFESQNSWQPNHPNHKPDDNHTHLNWKSIENRHDLNFKSVDNQNHLNLKPIDNQHHLNLKSIDNQIIRITKQLTTTFIWVSNQLPTNIIWISNQFTTKSFESQINWQPNHLNLKSDDKQISWISNRLTTKSFDSQFTWIWHQLTFEPLELNTPSSYRFLIFGNFRHRLVR